MRVTANPIPLFFIFTFVALFIVQMHPDLLISSSGFVVFLIITLQSFIFVLFSKGLLGQTYWVFSLLFFGIVPIIEINYGVKSYFGMPKLSDFDIFKAGVYIFFFNLVYASFYALSFFKKSHNLLSYNKCGSPHQASLLSNVINQNLCFFVFFATGISCFVLVFDELGRNILALFFRGGDFVTESQDWGPKKLIIERFIRPLPMICFLSFFLLYGLKRKIKITLLFLIALITAFPTSLPRFFAAALYIPILFIIFPILRRGVNYFYFLTLSVLFIFPLLNSFRRFSTNEEFKLVSIGDLRFFVEGHFDSFQTFAQVMTNNIITYGNQLLIVLFFWVPRKYWPDKPLSSGVEIGQSLGAYFTNMSANIFAEGWLNFGFLGAFLFAICLGCITKFFDCYFNPLMKISLNSLNLRDKFYVLSYFIMAPMLFITLRGDLVTGVSNILGIFTAWFVVFLLSKMINKSRF
ncbi:hypothetical protein [Rheinheimera sp. UJ63]|uniref:hypothetical protein n=1 Tax=Rheinheimera sp. UJ63 TaxID=2910157 RepID=UPI001F43AFD5|nr:hypothetical protein [Rheinheimera sp. UJ63]MCF4009281.1 hypothetical protein [Rheinheimera sp. UJ63]